MTQVYDASTPETSRLVGETLDGAWYCERCYLEPITAAGPFGIEQIDVAEHVTGTHQSYEEWVKDA